MPGTVEIVCLANSRKHSGRCIAGLKTDGSGWVRPVAPGRDGTLHPAEYRLQDGSEPTLLDILQIGCDGPKPLPHQPENQRVDKTHWQLLDQPASDVIPALLRASLVKGPLLLGNFGDKRDYSAMRLAPMTASLVLIAPESLTWQIKTSMRGNRQTKADFRLAHTPYCLSITDPVWTQKLAHLPVGLYPRDEVGLNADDQVLFTISLSEPFEWNNHCYKLVAGVIILPLRQD